MGDLEKTRAEIREIDEQMAALFQKRMEVVRDVADYKRERGLPVLDEEQENAKGLEIKSVNAFSPEGWEQRDDGSEIKKAFTDPQTGASLSFLRLHPGYCQEKEAVVNTGLFVIRGELESDLFSLKENTMIWLPAGYRRRWQAGKQGCLLLKIGNQGF